MTLRFEQDDVIRRLALALEARLRAHDGSMTGSWLIGVADALRELAGELAQEGYPEGAASVLQASLAVLREARGEDPQI